MKNLVYALSAIILLSACSKSSSPVLLKKRPDSTSASISNIKPNDTLYYAGIKSYHADLSNGVADTSYFEVYKILYLDHRALIFHTIYDIDYGDMNWGYSGYKEHFIFKGSIPEVDSVDSTAYYEIRFHDGQYSCLFKEDSLIYNGFDWEVDAICGDALSYSFHGKRIK